MARERGRQRFGLGVRVPDAIRLRGAGLRDFVAQAAQFLVLGSLQPADLLFQVRMLVTCPTLVGTPQNSR